MTARKLEFYEQVIKLNHELRASQRNSLLKDSVIRDLTNNVSMLSDSLNKGVKASE